ncbi:MAG TPA: hypothetical protein VHA13_01805 [Gammaproteobacteria bacterium]|nr:hypothetical protein [Gammaproteobacteria bacterium]
MQVIGVFMREYEITKEGNIDWLFIDKWADSKGYVCYMHFIEQVLLDFLKGHNIDECKTAFNIFYQSYLDKYSYPKNEVKNLPLKLYHITENDGVVLVDETRYCFPLVIDNVERREGFAHAINNINDKIDLILKELVKHAGKKWNLSLQKIMDGFDNRDLGRKEA